MKSSKQKEEKLAKRREVSKKKRSQQYEKYKAKRREVSKM